MRLRTRGFSPRLLLTRWRKFVRSRLEKESNTNSADPSIASLGIWVCDVLPWERQSLAFQRCRVPLTNTMPRENHASPTHGFSCRGLFALSRIIARH